MSISHKFLKFLQLGALCLTILLFQACSSKESLQTNRPILKVSTSNFTGPVQKLADTPKDRPIRVKTSTGYELCYIPTFSIGEQNYSYIGMLNCSVHGVIPARYDVFGRLAYSISDTWLCITAPEEVALKRRGSDYLYLYPCVINMKNQQWKLKDGVFYSHDESYSIKDDGYYLYAANDLASGLSSHTLHPSMQEWANTIATPGNISIATYISWDIIDKYAQERYFIYNNASGKNTVTLFYNLLSGHVAQYDALSGSLYCMYSNTGKQEWDWVVWGLCTDAKPPKNNRAYFRPIPTSGNTFAFKDKDGNFLRVTRYGIHWGVPYVASQEFIKKDKSNSPVSDFRVSKDLGDWMKFVFANIGKNLLTCPAGVYNEPKGKNLTGKKFARSASSPDQTISSFNENLGFDEARNTKQISLMLTQNRPALPPNFSLTNGWIRRLYDIASTAQPDVPLVGMCGVCLLQSFQIIAELMHDPYTPMERGGYFFDTSYGANPFISFRERNSMLYDTLSDISGYYNQDTPLPLDSFLRLMDRLMASSISMLPQYDWNRVGYSTAPGDPTALLQRMLNAPIGSMFLLSIGLYDPQRQQPLGHASVALRLNDGVVVIPVNIVSFPLESFAQHLTPSSTTSELLREITLVGTRNLQLFALGVFEILGPYTNSFEEFVSVNNCSGDGEDRRGSGLLPLPELINQCISGRCE